MEREVTFTFPPFRLKVDENAIETKKEEQSSGEQKLEGKQILHGLRIMRSTWRLQSSI